MNIVVGVISYLVKYMIPLIIMIVLSISSADSFYALKVRSILDYLNIVIVYATLIVLWVRLIRYTVKSLIRLAEG